MALGTKNCAGLLGAIVALWSLYGCETSASSSAGIDDAGSDAEGGAAGALQDGSTDATDGDARDARAEPPYDAAAAEGQSLVIVSNQMGTGTASAYVELYPDGNPCTFSEIEMCRIEVCRSYVPVAGSAGTIEITGIGQEPVSFTSSAAVPAFSGGEQVHVAASGGDTPAYAVELTAPGLIAVTAPTESVVPLSPVPVTATWTGGTSGDVVIALTQPSSGGGPSTQAKCVYDATAGTGTVPDAVFDAFDRTRGITVLVMAEAYDIRYLENWELRTAVRQTAYIGEGRFPTM